MKDKVKDKTQDVELKRLLDSAKAYTLKSRKEHKRLALTEAGPSEPTLPNDKGRANKAIRTREQRHGKNKLTKAGEKALSNDE